MSKPANVLFLLTDQWPATHFSHRGAPVRTPAVDSLAAAGTVFTNAFTTCPLCSPARGTLLSAQWPWRTGMLDNYSVGYSTQPPLARGVRTWLEAAVERGFRVGYFGKWHLGPDGPRLRGAHESSPGIDAGRKPFDNDKVKHSYRMVLERQSRDLERLVDGVPPFYGTLKGGIEETHAHRCMTEALGFLDRYAAGRREQPFCLTASFTGPHFPHYLPREYATMYRPQDVPLPASLEDGFGGKPWFHGTAWWPSMDTSGLDEAGWRKAIAYTWGHMTMVDHAIGRILGDLERHGLADDTLVIFAADHGDVCGEHNRFDKGPYFYEEVLRIPLVIRRPGTGAALQPAFVSLIDLGATLFAAAGQEEHAASSQGRDLQPLVGADDPGWPREVFATYHLYNGISFECRCVRTERYKYVWNLQEIDELYDLEEDPIEMRNRIGDPALAEVEKDLRARLQRWLQENGDDTPGRATELPRAGTIVVTGESGP